MIGRSKQHAHYLHTCVRAYYSGQTFLQVLPKKFVRLTDLVWKEGLEILKST